jgi:predicted O-linked N-acetylglucosamine transferase (SPINDLY family)
MSLLLQRKKDINELISLYLKKDFLNVKIKLSELKIKFPNDFYLENFSGVIYSDEGLDDLAILSFKKSIKFNPNFCDSYINISKILRKKNIDKSIEYLQEVIKIKKDYLPGYRHLIDCLMKAKKFHQALDVLRNLLNLKINKDNHYVIYHNVGSCYYGLNNFKSALKFFLKAHQLNKSFQETLLSLGMVCSQLNENENALHYFNLALDTKVDQFKVFKNLGDFYKKNKNYHLSIDHYEKSININPNYYLALESLADLFYILNKFKLAEKYFLKSLEIEKNSVFSKLGLAEVYMSLLNHEKAIFYLEEALKEDKFSKETLEAYIFFSNYITNFKKDYYLVLTKKFNNLVGTNNSPNETPKVKKVKNIGFLGSTFFEHAVGLQIIDVIIEMSKQDNIKIFAFSNLEKNDLVAIKFKKSFYMWNDVSHLSDEKVIKLIREQEIDVLIDLDGYTKNHRLVLFANKPAPIQISWCGYLNSTGIEGIKYLIADSYVVDSNIEKKYTEKILKLPEIFTNMSIPTFDLSINKKIPAFHNKYLTFGSFNNPLKLNSRVIKTWSEILCRIKGSQLILLYGRFADVDYQEYIRNFFLINGVNKTQILFEGYKDRKILMETYNRIDIALDTFPYGGMTTSMEAVYMGVPVFTMVGDSFLSRGTYSLNKNLGLEEYIASNEQEYISKIINISNNIDKIQETKTFLLSNRNNFIFFNPKKFTKQFVDLITGLN